MKKEANRADARAVVLSLTARGRKVWRATMDVVARRNDEIFGSLDPAERKRLSDLLDRLIDQARHDLQAGGWSDDDDNDAGAP